MIIDRSATMADVCWYMLHKRVSNSPAELQTVSDGTNISRFFLLSWARDPELAPSYMRVLSIYSYLSNPRNN